MGSKAERLPDRIVLVVDDEPAVRSLVLRVLHDAGLLALGAASGAEAVEVLESASAGVGVVVSDASMPGMSGSQLAAILAERWPTIPFLLLSGEPQNDWPGPFLGKPVTPAQLVSTVEGLLPSNGTAPRLRLI